MSRQPPIRVPAREWPLDAALSGIASSPPTGTLAGEGGLVSGTAREALAHENADLDINHVALFSRHDTSPPFPAGALLANLKQDNHSGKAPITGWVARLDINARVIGIHGTEQLH